MPNHTPEQLAKALAMALTTERGPRLLRDYAAAWDALHPNEQPPWVVVERDALLPLAHTEASIGPDLDDDEEADITVTVGQIRVARRAVGGNPNA